MSAQVVTPAGAVSAAAAAAAAQSSSPAVAQPAPVIGVRTLLEFVAWLVGTALLVGSPKSRVPPGSATRAGSAFLTEELSHVGTAVRRMQV